MPFDFDRLFALFQSTHPVWDATGSTAPCVAKRKYFNPRIPYGMRPARSRSARFLWNFNPRIPYGMRRLGATRAGLPRLFQSTHPVWDATARMDIAFHNMEIFARSSS